MLCKGSYTGTAQIRMRYQAVDAVLQLRDDAWKKRYSVVFKCRNISDVNIE
jgi:hypothetical protein